MAWTNEQILKFQMDNSSQLEEINKTLLGFTDKPKIGIFAPFQNGDAITCGSILKYKDYLWPDKDIVWFSNYPTADFLKHSKEVSEVRPWPWAGAGLPEGTPDFYPLLCDENNKLNKELAKEYELTKDLENGYFPCAWMWSVKQRHGVEYPNISKKIFGIPDDWEWHPVLSFSDEERGNVIDFINDMPVRYNICIETFAGSGQSILNDEQVRKSMQICKDILGECNFVFVSHKYLNGNEAFPQDFLEDEDIYFAKDFTVRQCALIVGECDFMISVSSGITVAASCWDNIGQPFKTLQFCGSAVCSTKGLYHNRHFELITHDEKPLEEAQNEFYYQLRLILKSI